MTAQPSAERGLTLTAQANLHLKFAHEAFMSGDNVEARNRVAQARAVIRDAENELFLLQVREDNLRNAIAALQDFGRSEVDA